MRPLTLALCLATLGGCSIITVEQQPFAPLRVTGKRPPPPPPRVVLTESSIQIGEKVQFGFDSADILPASHGLLTEVAQVLRDNPQIELVQILPVRGERVLRQSVFQPQRVGEGIEQRRGRRAHRSWKASALASCISSQRLASIR